LLALADEADDDGVSAAADRHVAKKCGMSDEAFLQAIKLLESAGRLAIGLSGVDVLNNAKR